jgi:hypothetical protein
MTIALLLNIEAGIGHHVWDLTYPRVVAIGRYSTQFPRFVRNVLTTQQPILPPSSGASNYFYLSTAFFAYIFAYFRMFG